MNSDGEDEERRRRIGDPDRVGQRPERVPPHGEHEDHASGQQPEDARSARAAGGCESARRSTASRISAAIAAKMETRTVIDPPVAVDGRRKSPTKSASETLSM